MTNSFASTAGGQTGRRHRLGLMGLVVVATVFGVALIGQFELPFNSSPVDLLMASLIMVRIPALFRWAGVSGVTLRKVIPYVWLFVLGTLISLFSSGFSFEIALVLLKNALPFMAFFALWSVFEERPSLIPLAHWSYIAASLFVLITVLSDSGYRAGGVLQVNYAAHFLGVGLLLTLYLPIKLPFRIVLAGALLVGILQTGSFGGLALLAGFFAYWLWTRQDLVAGNSRFVIRALIVLAIVVLVPIAEVRLGESGLGVGSGFESDRYERSSDGRREMYERGVQSAIGNPWGVGPGQYRDVTGSGVTPEMHSDPLSFLLENGLIGLIGIVGILWKIAGSTSQGGLARIMLTGLILSSFGRQTWNFRHAWVALAIAIALDQAQRVSRNQNAGTAAAKDLR